MTSLADKLLLIENKDFLIDKEDNNVQKMFEAFSDDYWCRAEHEMIGSSSPKVLEEFRWTPYAILGGISIDQVNEHRVEFEYPICGVYFGLEDDCRVNVKLQPVNPDTLCVNPPMPISARYIKNNDKPIIFNEEQQKNLQFIDDPDFV